MSFWAAWPIPRAKNRTGPNTSPSKWHGSIKNYDTETGIERESADTNSHIVGTNLVLHLIYLFWGQLSRGCSATIVSYRAAVTARELWRAGNWKSIIWSTFRKTGKIVPLALIWNTKYVYKRTFWWATIERVWLGDSGDFDIAVAIVKNIEGVDMSRGGSSRALTRFGISRTEFSNSFTVWCASRSKRHLTGTIALFWASAVSNESSRIELCPNDTLTRRLCPFSRLDSSLSLNAENRS